MESRAKQTKVYIVYAIAGALLLLSVLLIMTARLSDDFAEWYALNVYPFFVGTIGAVNGLLPFSLGEMLVYLFIIGIVFLIALLIVKLIRGKTRRKAILLHSGAVLLSIVSAIALLFTLFCGINYYRYPYSRYSGLAVREYSAEELCSFTEYIIERLSEASMSISRNENFTSIPDCDIAEEARAAMYRLSEDNGVLATSYPRPKAVVSSRLMSYAHILGIYFPFTIEANYNYDGPDADEPHTVCHELSHLTGFMREDEANYLAYLACRGSLNPYFIYSGYYCALKFLLEACYNAVDYDEYCAIYNKIPQEVALEYGASAVYWKQFDTPVADVVNTVNDTYLKANNQSDGIKSYGRFIDLMLAEYYSE